MRKSFWTGLLSVAVAGALALPAFAAGAGGGGGGGGAGAAGRGRGNGAGRNPGGPGANPGAGGPAGRQPQDPAAVLASRLAAIKGQLSATDQEWTILSDKISAVIKLQTELNVGRQNGGGLPGGRRGAAPGAVPAGPTPLPTITVDPANPVSGAAGDLNTKAADATADLKGPLAALRDARAKLTVDLKKAQDDLKGVVTVRQEAILVSLGILE